MQKITPMLWFDTQAEEVLNERLGEPAAAVNLELIRLFKARKNRSVPFSRP